MAKKSRGGHNGGETGEPFMPPAIYDPETAKKSKELDSEEDKKEVDRLAKKLGINISPTIRKQLGEKRMRESLEDVQETIDMFDIDEDYQHFIVHQVLSYAGKRAYAAANGAGDLYINPGNLGDEKTAALMYEYDVHQGFHPKGTTYRDVIAHETGHLIDSFLGKQKGQSFGSDQFDKRMYYMYERGFSRDTVKEAISNLQKTPAFKGKSASFIKEQLSGYAAEGKGAKNGVEAFAEAIGDYRRNRDNANPLSLEIVKIVRRELKSMGLTKS